MKNYRKKANKKIPPCLGYRDYFGEFDCEYLSDVICENCICNWEIGGTLDPQTGKKFTGFIPSEIQ